MNERSGAGCTDTPEPKLLRAEVSWGPYLTEPALTGPLHLANNIYS